LTGAEDVLSAFGIEPGPPAAADVSPSAAALLELVRAAPAGADTLARQSGLDAGEVARALVELELNGLVAAADGLYRAVAV
jgi:predicted Rossmann fold nucleotide-binding protein DprA/Smf involved in DNA uptake